MHALRPEGRKRDFEGESQTPLTTNLVLRIYDASRKVFGFPPPVYQLCCCSGSIGSSVPYAVSTRFVFRLEPTTLNAG